MKKTNKSIKHTKLKKQIIVKNINDKNIVPEIGYAENAMANLHKSEKIVCRLLDPKFPKD